MQSFSRCNFLSPFLSSFPSTVFVEWAIRAVVVVMLSVSLTLSLLGRSMLQVFSTMPPFVFAREVRVARSCFRC